MLITGTIAIVVVLFYLLGKSADIVVTQVRSLGNRFKIPLSFLGIILGLLTTLPELSIGIHAVIENIPSVSLGNLIGGIMVIFGLIFGGSLILNRRMSTDGNIWHILPFFSYILIALLMGLDGTFSEIDGVILMLIYLGILFSLYEKYHKIERSTRATFVHHHKMSKHIVYIILGAAAVVVLSKIIITLSTGLLQIFNVPIFIAGLLAFSIGTNLPEIVVTIRSWRQHIQELSTGNLVGSAIANPFIIGLLAFLRPVPVSVDLSYYVTIVFVVLLFSAFLVFYKTGKRLTATEGSVLVSIYIAFVASQWIISA